MRSSLRFLRCCGSLMALLLACSAVATEAPEFSVAPSQGHSLFQEVFAGADGRAAIPFPFSALMARLRQELAPGETALRGGLPLVLIPLGRSLQRQAAEDAGYFTHPRVVLAVTGEPRPGAPLLKDRLYIGYQELAGVLEVISYNEGAGRFEFQLVHDYRPGGRPRLVQARRELCLACHHGAEPIFSRQSWDETGANPAIARLLEAELAPSLRALPWRGGVDIPNAIDDATERASRLGLAQRLWQEGCGAGPQGDACRGELLVRAVLLRLALPAPEPSGTADALAPLLGRWTEGVALPSPDILNRLPLDPASREPPGPTELRRVADVAAPFDPLALRPPRDRWDGRQPGAVREAAAAVGLFLAAPELEAIERALSRLSPSPAAAVLRRAVAAMAKEEGGPLSAGPLDRRGVVPGLLRGLGMADVRCCGPARPIAPPGVDAPRPIPAGLGPEMIALFRHCAACHDGNDPFPPGFLAGEGEGLRRRVAACAPRMAYRLAMGAVAPAQRAKTPMPPPARAAGFAASADYRTLIAWLPSLAGRPLETLLSGPYAELPPCRPEPDRGASHVRP
jgi:hypothetical protein